MAGHFRNARWTTPIPVACPFLATDRIKVHHGGGVDDRIQAARDVWQKKGIGNYNNELSQTVSAHGAVLIKLQPAK
jgi:hypothetical protein